MTRREFTRRALTAAPALALALPAPAAAPPPRLSPRGVALLRMVGRWRRTRGPGVICDVDVSEDADFLRNMTRLRVVLTDPARTPPSPGVRLCVAVQVPNDRFASPAGLERDLRATLDAEGTFLWTAVGATIPTVSLRDGRPNRPHGFISYVVAHWTPEGP
jgi:hypothetical protein